MLQSNVVKCYLYLFPVAEVQLAPASVLALSNLSCCNNQRICGHVFIVTSLFWCFHRLYCALGFFCLHCKD